MANLSYNKWNNTKLGIAFEKGTNVLSISFIDKDKDFIIDVLNLISSNIKVIQKQKRKRADKYNYFS